MKYIVRRADLVEDKKEIISILSRNFGVAKERYEWIYESNIAGKADCWIALEEAGKKAVGSTALFPRRLYIGGKLYNAAIAGDFCVNKENRTFGPALNLQRKVLIGAAARRFKLIYGFPNRQSELVHLRVGYKVFGNVSRFTKPLRSFYFLNKTFRATWLAKLLSIPADLWLCFSSKRAPKNWEKYEVEQPFLFDERFETCWLKLKDQFYLIGERSPSYLNWRYMASPHQGYRIFAISRTLNKEIIGYIVYNVSDGGAYINDLGSADMSESFNLLLFAFIKEKRREGLQWISTTLLTESILSKKLIKFGFKKRGPEGKVIVYAPSENIDIKKLTSEKGWFLLHGDNDI